MTQSNFLFSLVSVSEKAEKDIISFQTLPFGWHFGRGRPASSDAVAEALRMRGLLLQLGAKKIEAFPRTSGEIVVSALNGPDTVDVTCSGNGSYDLFIERDDATVVDEKRVSLRKLAEMVRFLGWREAVSSGYFTRDTTLGRGVDLTVQLYRNLPTVFPSLTRPARHAVAHVFAHTYLDSMKKESRGLPLSFSDSTSEKSRVVYSHKTPQRRVTHATS
jgi:hypothetical protein